MSRGRERDRVVTRGHAKRLKMEESPERSLSPDSRYMYMPLTLDGLESFLRECRNDAHPRYTGLDLSFIKNQITDKHLNLIIENFSNIKRLCLSNCTNLSPAALAKLPYLSGLEKIDISLTETSADTVRALAKLKSLQEFHFSHVATDESLTDAILGMKKLKALDISGNKNITDDNIQSIFNKFPNLALLDITNCDKINEGVVDYIYSKSQNINVFDTISRGSPGFSHTNAYKISGGALGFKL